MTSTGDAMTYVSAGELRDDCAAVPRMLAGEARAISAAGECIAFIDGWRAFAKVVEVEHKLRVICIPETITTVDLAVMYVQAIDRTPAARAAPVEGSLYGVVVDRFPCRA